MGRAGNGVYLAGDGVRLLGADGAEIAGRLAAAACLADLGHPARLQRRSAQLARLERFALGLACTFPWPVAMVRALPDDAIVCRCENVSAGDIRKSVIFGGGEANRVKSLSRVGMGDAGRYCQLAAVELVAAQADCTPGAVGRFRGQAPVRPAPYRCLSPGRLMAIGGPHQDGMDHALELGDFAPRRGGRDVPGVGTGIDDRFGAGDQVGDEMAGARPDAEAVAAEPRPPG